VLRGVVERDEGLESGHVIGDRDDGRATDDELQQRVEYRTDLRDEILDVGGEVAVVFGDDRDDVFRVGFRTGLQVRGGGVEQQRSRVVHGADGGQGGVELRLVLGEGFGDGLEAGARNDGHEKGERVGHGAGSHV
jgi:hypothetical protein